MFLQYSLVLIPEDSILPPQSIKKKKKKKKGTIYKSPRLPTLPTFHPSIHPSLSRHRVKHKRYTCRILKVSNANHMYMYSPIMSTS